MKYLHSYKKDRGGGRGVGGEGEDGDEEATIQMANRKMSKCSASIIIWEVPIMTTASYHLTGSFQCWNGCY